MPKRIATMLGALLALGFVFTAVAPTVQAVPLPAATDTVTVTFDPDANDVAVPDPIVVPVGSVAASVGHVFPTLHRRGWTLAGWNTARDGKGTMYTAGTPVFEDITLYADWMPNRTVTVTFGGARATKLSQSSITLNFGQSVGDVGSMPEVSRTGFLFAGWNTAANGTGDPFGATTRVYEDTIVYAQWVIENDVTLTARIYQPKQHAVWRPVGTDRWERISDTGTGEAIPAGAAFAVVTSSDPVHAPSRNVSQALDEARRLARAYSGTLLPTTQGQAWRGPARIVAFW